MENRPEVERICTEALRVSSELEVARSNEQNLRRLYDYQVAGVRELLRQAEVYVRQIRALGYHDIGHARTVLSREDPKNI